MVSAPKESEDGDGVPTESEDWVGVLTAGENGINSPAWMAACNIVWKTE